LHSIAGPGRPCGLTCGTTRPRSSRPTAAARIVAKNPGINPHEVSKSRYQTMVHAARRVLVKMLGESDFSREGRRLNVAVDLKTAEINRIVAKDEEDATEVVPYRRGGDRFVDLSVEIEYWVDLKVASYY